MVRALELDLADLEPLTWFWSAKHHFVGTCCQKRICVTLFLGKENSDFLFPYLSGASWQLAKAKKAFHAFHIKAIATTGSSKKAQSSSCSDLDTADQVTVPVPQEMEVSILIWAKPSELETPLLSTNQRTFIFSGPQTLSWRPSTIKSQEGRVRSRSYDYRKCVRRVWNILPVVWIACKASTDMVDLGLGRRKKGKKQAECKQRRYAATRNLSVSRCV